GRRRTGARPAARATTRALGALGVLRRRDARGGLRAAQTSVAVDGARALRANDGEGLSLRSLVARQSLSHHLLHRARRDPARRLVPLSTAATTRGASGRELGDRRWGIGDWGFRVGRKLFQPQPPIPYPRFL